VSDDSVQVKFGTQIDGLVAGIDAAKAQIEGITAPIDGIKSAFAGLADVIGVSFAINKITEFADRFAELGEQIDRTSKITGVSTGDIQAFSLAVKMAGGDSDTAAMTLNILQKNIGAAISAAGPARTAFENMGISLAQLKTTDVVTLLFEIKQRMDEAGTSAEQSALKQEYLRAVAGRSAAQFLALGLSLEQVKKIAAETGYTMSPQMVGQAKRLADQTHELDAAWVGLSNTLGSIIAPAYEAMISKTKGLIESTTNLMSIFTVKGGSPAIGFFDALSKLKTNPQTGGSSGTWGTGQDLGEGQFGPPAPPKPLPELDTSSGGSDARDQVAREESNTQVELSKLAFEQIAQDQDALVAQFKETEADKVQALIAATELMVQTQQKALDDEAKSYDEDSVAFKQVQDKKTILAAQSDLEISRLNEQLAVAQAKQYQESLAPWKQLMGDMGGALDQMISGVLTGTQSLKEVMLRAWSDMAIKFTEVMAKMTAEYLAFKATQTGTNTASGILGFGTVNPFSALGGASGGGANAATQALTTAITGNTASTLTNTGGILQEVESGLKWIAQTLGLTTATTAQVTASTAATTATTANATATTGLIPALAALTAAIWADVGASSGGFLGAVTAAGSAGVAGASIASLDVGAWNIPQNGLAFLHAGEMVIPANAAQTFRAGSTNVGSGAGGTMNMNISLSAIDTQSGMSFLQSNAVNLGNIIAQQVRNGHTGLVNAVKS
jgi:hypothetical protein